MENNQEPTAQRTMEPEYVRNTNLSKEQEFQIKRVTEEIENAAYYVRNFLPPCRDNSLALTKLEEASMWATKAVTHHS